MIKLADNLWIGNSEDEKLVKEYVKHGLIDSVLVVAHDMRPSSGWNNRVEYAQVGLIDGPGNQLCAYHAAVLALVSLSRRKKVLVCCHNGGRSLAVVIMHQYLLGDGPSWDEYMERFKRDVKGLEVRVHGCHRKAFFLMDWGMLTRVLDGEVNDENG